MKIIATGFLPLAVIAILAIAISTATQPLHAQEVQPARRGDVNGVGSLDIHDIAAELDWMRRSEVPPAADLTADGKVNIFDLLKLLTQMRWLGESGDGEFRAVVKINRHLLCEPMVEIGKRLDVTGEVWGDFQIKSKRKLPGLS